MLQVPIRPEPMHPLPQAETASPLTSKQPEAKAQRSGSHRANVHARACACVELQSALGFFFSSCTSSSSSSSRDVRMLIEESSISMVQMSEFRAQSELLMRVAQVCVGVLQHTGERRIPAGPPHVPTHCSKRSAAFEQPHICC